MLALFLAFFSASILFVTFFLVKLGEDVKSQSLRPMFVMLLAIGFWIGTLSAFVAPEIPSSTVYPAVNIIVGNSISNSIAQYPLQNITTTPAALPARDYNAYFNIWLTVFFFYGVLIVLWYYFLIRRKAMEAMEKANPVEGFERRTHR